MLLSAKEHINDFGQCSVIMPVYNSEQYIGTAIESVLNQTYRNLELVIVNDSSKDKSLQIIEKYASLDARVKAISFTENKGCAAARNKGIDIANGKYIAFIDSDDIWFPEKLEKQISLLENKKAGLVYTSYNMIDSNGDIIKTRNIKSKITFNDLLKENSIIFSSVICLKKDVADIKFIKEWYHEDYVFLLTLLKKNIKFLGINEILVNYRIHSKGRSFNKVNAAKYRWLIYRKVLMLDYFQTVINFIYYIFYGFKKYMSW